MDKSAIKSFAVSARIKLKEQIKQKAYTFGITKDKIKTLEMFEDTFEVNGSKYDIRLLKYREGLVKKVNEKGLEQLLEEVAYTWFNRLIAIRFMEVNEYLPSGIRVLSSTDSSKAEPDIIRESTNLEFENLNIDLIYKLQDENNIEELFRYLLVKQCNELGKIMPVVFEEIEDYTELLLPDNLLQEGSVIRELVTSINEDDWKEQVEIIGWLYQYYISEKKDQVFAELKKNVKITKENIPAATQLFTPDWIVKYMVQNSLGRLWLESHPDEELKAKWKYYIEEAKQEPKVQSQLQAIRNRNISPEGIKVLDPCMGSGHILVYAFEVLYNIYKSAGYSEREIPKLILEKNLYGLDVDDRAAQLAYFAVMMKARSYNRRIFRGKIDFNICAIQESNDFPKEAIDYLVNSKETQIEKQIKIGDVEYFINVFSDAKEYGSIIEVKEIDFDRIERRVEEIRNGDTYDIFELQYKNVILEKIPALIKQAKIMCRSYDVVCTNPPYMGSRNMSNNLSKFIKNKYVDSKNDLYSVFIERCMKNTLSNGYCALITMHSWMFIKRFIDLRYKIINNFTISSLVHLGSRAFEEISGEVVQTVTFILKNAQLGGYLGTYTGLTKFSDPDLKSKEFFNKKNTHFTSANKFNSIQENPIVYWISDKFESIFKENNRLGDLCKVKMGLQTSENEKFLRLWYEVNYNKIGFGFSNREDAQLSNNKWFPHCKSSGYRKWYGNDQYLVNWQHDGKEIREYCNYLNTKKNSQMGIANTHCYFKEGITWPLIGTSKFSIRYFPKGMIFNVSAPAIFDEPDKNMYYLGLLNSKVTHSILELLNPTLNFSSGVISNIPVKQKEDTLTIDVIKTKVCENIEICKKDWDSFETSYDFNIHPLIQHRNISTKVEDVFNSWLELTKQQFYQLKLNEEELNKIFITIYELEDELFPKVDDRDITIMIADREKDIRSFISYAIGCMFGRYSLNEQGLIYAGGEFNQSRYQTFKVNLINVVPITDDEYFEGDIVTRFVEFVKINFSKETLEGNLDYIADTLGQTGNETSRQTIRRYFLKDFFKDHLRIYQKRPIYWLFDSGKNDGFKALIYMHRYDIDTVAIVRTDYLHLLQRKYEAEVNRLDMIMENDNESVREKTEAKKKKEKIQKQILECVQYDQVIAHVANQKISLDLDDGVKVNYDKFQGVEVPQGEGKKALKADLLAKI